MSWSEIISRRELFKVGGALVASGSLIEALAACQPENPRTQAERRASQLIKDDESVTIFAGEVIITRYSESNGVLTRTTEKVKKPVIFPVLENNPQNLQWMAYINTDGQRVVIPLENNPYQSITNSEDGKPLKSSSLIPGLNLISVKIKVWSPANIEATIGFGVNEKKFSIMEATAPNPSPKR